MDEMREILKKFKQRKLEEKTLISISVIETIINNFQDNINYLLNTNTRTDKVKIRTLTYCINHIKEIIK